MRYYFIYRWLPVNGLTYFALVLVLALALALDQVLSINSALTYSCDVKVSLIGYIFSVAHDFV